MRRYVWWSASMECSVLRHVLIYKQRLQTMMEEHDRNLDRLRTAFAPREMWYLEVIAVRPALQGRGIGKRLLNEVLSEISRDGPAVVVLESTSLESKRLYERCGFEVIEEVVLADAGDQVKVWLMSWSTEP
jgi:ribosomal protein S18 acetylase RimI-like enzyme